MSRPRTSGLGDRLAARRESSGFTREQVAVEIHRSFSTVVGYEHGTITPPIRVLIELAALYEVPVGDLLAPAVTSRV